MKTAENCGFGIGPSSGKELLGAGQKVEGEGGVGRRKMGGGSASFEPSQRVGHPSFQPVVEWVMIISD